MAYYNRSLNNIQDFHVEVRPAITGAVFGDLIKNDGGAWAKCGVTDTPIAFFAGSMAGSTLPQEGPYPGPNNQVYSLVGLIDEKSVVRFAYDNPDAELTENQKFNTLFNHTADYKLNTAGGGAVWKLYKFSNEEGWADCVLAVSDAVNP